MAWLRTPEQSGGGHLEVREPGQEEEGLHWGEVKPEQSEHTEEWVQGSPQTHCQLMRLTSNTTDLRKEVGSREK